ncbi:MAG: hypothetical protein CVU89_06265 [Firmicutes bacterium HGW-Firmicutes-14]|nr:MAG: hypothetical protein CVU89_06265 [Firmicutes bacterium HGW-Firmicutes-14]
MIISYQPQNICIELVLDSGKNKKPHEYMSLDLLKQLVREIDRWPSIKKLVLLNLGESLLYPHFRDCLEILAESKVIKDALTILHINASLMLGEKAKALLDIPIIKKVMLESDEVTAINRVNNIFKPLGIQVEAQGTNDYNEQDLLDVSKKKKTKVFGGCSFIEDNSLFVHVNGKVSPCCAVYEDRFSIGVFPDCDFGTLLNNSKMCELRHKLRLDQRGNLPFCKNCLQSIGGNTNYEHLKKFWLEKDKQEQIDNLEERKYIFGDLLYTEHKVVRVDLGCGPAKRPGFIGVDRFPQLDVDKIGNLNEKLPFEDNSVDLVYASHSLEHVKDLMNTMKEIYRICKHGTQICILAPYYEQKLNFANPYHIQVFNEHTPRFWTDYPYTNIPQDDWLHPNALTWGLSKSDHGDPGIDLRCVKMEFFYFPEYRHLTLEEKRQARKEKTDVCEEILFHLIAVKKAISEEEYIDMINRMEYYEPPHISIKRQNEIIEELRKNLLYQEEELRRLEDKLNEREETLKFIEKDKENLIEKLHASEEELRKLEDKLNEREETLKFIEKDKENLIEKLRSTKSELESIVNEKAEKQLRRKKIIKDRAINVVYSKEFLIQSRRFRFIEMFKGSDMWETISPAFQQLKDDAVIFGMKEKKYKLGLSVNLQEIPFEYYELDIHSGTLQGVYLAVNLELPYCQGNIGAELVAKDQILANNEIQIADVDANLPLFIPFHPVVLDENNKYYLRIFARNSEIPIRVFEFYKYNWWGKRYRKPFIGFKFKT